MISELRVRDLATIADVTLTLGPGLNVLTGETGAGKSIIMDTKEGFVKLLANPATGESWGGCCVGPQGGELIHEIVAAMAKRMTVQELAAMPHYHPTLAEIWTYPAEELAALIVHLA